jgi:sugar phosphate isomerase/epimerase
MYGSNNPYMSLPMDENYRVSPAYQVDSMLDVPIEASKDDFSYGEFAPTLREIGGSANPFEHQTKALLARIKEGASRVEFTFMGAGKGNKQSFTPETFGKDEREEMRALAKINQVETSTHASTAAGPLSGFGQQGFNEEQRMNALKEIKKAVDFAAEATTGGAVVVHIGEWQRGLETNFQKDSDKYGQFRKFESNTIVDSESGKLASELVSSGVVSNDELKKIQDMADWELKTYRGGKFRRQSEKDVDAYILADRESGKITALNRDMRFSVAETDNDGKYVLTDDGSIKFKHLTFNELIEDVNNRVSEHEKEAKRLEKLGQSEAARKEREKAKQLKYRSDGVTQKTDGEKVLFDYYMKDIGYQKAWGKSYIENARELEDRNKELLSKDVSSLSPDERKAYDQVKNKINDFYDIAMNSERSVADRMRMMENMVSVEEVGLDKTADTIAQAALMAHQKTREHKSELNHDIYISPESFLPDQYGGHPDEIRAVIKRSREKLAGMLRNQYNSKEAEEIASRHIKATLDAGHLNQWRKYFVKKDGESHDQYEKRFNKWLLDKTEELAKDGMVGHVHLSDNFGYDDEHLVPGEGNVPYKEFIKRMKQHGINEFINEPGSFNYEYALRNTWKNMGISNISAAYRGSGTPRSSPNYFNQVSNSYFGHTAKPSYVFGKYMPKVNNIEKSWGPWSGTPL